MAGDLCQKIPTHIILFHILPRLPVESLQCCKSVCQQWRSFLKTRYFASMYNRRLTNGSTVQSCHKLLFLPCNNKYERGFRIMDCEAPDDGGLISQWHPLPFKSRLAYNHNIQTSLHGLVCICGQFDKGKYTRSKTELVIWNPMTGEYKRLGKTNPHMKSYFSQVRALGLYYSGMSDDDKEYKLLTVSSDRSVHIYSLKSDSWRKVDSPDNYQTFSDLGFGREMISSSTWFNGNLYFLTERPAVLKFDTNVERFTIILTHPSLNDLDVKRLTMDVHKGVIHLGVHYETSQHRTAKKAHIQLWKMIEDENWEKVGVPFRIDISMHPFSWLRNKTWLMVESLQRGYKRGYGREYDKEEKLHKVDYSKSYTKGKNCVTNAKSTLIISLYDSHAKVNYIESFLSIDGSI